VSQFNFEQQVVDAVGGDALDLNDFPFEPIDNLPPLSPFADDNQQTPPADDNQQMPPANDNQQALPADNQQVPHTADENEGPRRSRRGRPPQSVSQVVYNDVGYDDEVVNACDDVDDMEEDDGVYVSDIPNRQRYFKMKTSKDTYDIPFFRIRKILRGAYMRHIATLPAGYVTTEDIRGTCVKWVPALDGKFNEYVDKDNNTRLYISDHGEFAVWSPYTERNGRLEAVKPPTGSLSRATGTITFRRSYVTPKGCIRRAAKKGLFNFDP
jgi:hypothetical protein